MPGIALENETGSIEASIRLQVRRNLSRIGTEQSRIALEMAAPQPAASGWASRWPSGAISKTERSGTSGQGSAVIGSEAISSAR
jgi:hypothetical protein